MTRRGLFASLIVMVVLAFGGVAVAAATGTRPGLGLDLQGGFSVVLQAREVDGRMPSEEAVEKAKDIIRQRVDGLGVAEPDITRQGHTVIVQLPGVTNRERAEQVVGCTARLEFRPVLASTMDPSLMPTLAPEPEVGTDDAPSTTASTPDTTVSDTPAEDDADDETGMGVVGIIEGESALPAQFVATTTTTTTTTVPVEPTIPAEPTDPADPADPAEDPADEPTERSSACGTGPSADIGPGESGEFPSANDDDPFIYSLGPVGFTGEALDSSQAAFDPQSGWTVVVQVSSGSVAAANTTFNECNQGLPTCPGDSTGTQPGRVAIVLDGAVLSAPAVQSQNLASNPDGLTISGDFNERAAKDLSLALRYGSLPVEFEQAALQQVSATLGSDSLRAGLIAGGIGILALAAYIVIYYRGFGLVVVVSLLVWGGLMYGLICLLSETQSLALTLAGITGIVVSVGTTVDTYVVVFERVKDEIRDGRSVRAATERGYEQGIRTVLTANGAAFIGAFLLWYLTVGPVRGFAYFLGLSLILDLAVAIMFTRPLIILLSRSPRYSNSALFRPGVPLSASDLAKGAAR